VYARVTELAGFAGRIEEYLERVRRHVLQPLQEAPGYAGYLNLVDRDADRVLVISMWRTADEMHASRDLVLKLRKEAADAVGAVETWVREYEVALNQRSSAARSSAGVRPRTARRPPPPRR
jgi:heme-degrading monooxygenase HmoA